jgi:D-inositol-3-phosphate glycosyltransferase
MPRESDCRLVRLQVAVLTGGGDKSYALGLSEALTAAGCGIDFVGSNDLDVPELRNNPGVRFLNLRGDMRSDVGAATKVCRVIKYYMKLIQYAATAKPRVLHILWNNKFEWFDRTVLMLYYRLLGKRVVFTAHNVNGRKRDGTDNWLNRLSLRIQYGLSHHVFVHTRRMKDELILDFCLPETKLTVIPFGINNTVPNTRLTPADAKQRLGLSSRDQVMLFFGRIAPYKGLDYLIDALGQLAGKCPDLRLVIAGMPKIVAGAAEEGENYWKEIQESITRTRTGERILQRIQFVPDEETELYFKAADVLVLPYRHIFQTGVLFLGFGFGLPAIAADVGSLKDEIIEGRTGFVFAAKDSAALASTIETYFSSDLFQNLERHRREIRDYANERYSWTKVAAMTTKVYSDLLEN